MTSVDIGRRVIGWVTASVMLLTFVFGGLWFVASVEARVARNTERIESMESVLYDMHERVIRIDHRTGSNEE